MFEKTLPLLIQAFSLYFSASKRPYIGVDFCESREKSSYCFPVTKKDNWSQKSNSTASVVFLTTTRLTILI